MFRYSTALKWILGAAALAFAVAGIGWLVRPAPGDPAEKFLARHWGEAVAPQGPPPENFPPLEASLAPQACGQCHPRQLADWAGSLHARTMGPGIRWQFHVLDGAQANRCLRCHAPLAEQKALLARERGWPNAPADPPPSYVPADLHRQGLVCAACHVRGHRRFGPPPAKPSTRASAHGGFVAEEAFGDSRFCAACHQFKADGPSLNGKLLENTFEEWRASPAARRGEHCQACHMPGRRHLWRGVHDPGMLQRALERRLAVTRIDARRVRADAVITNVGAGHYLPTYLVPKIYATLQLVEPDGRRRTLARHVIGRSADVDLKDELSDTRLAPGAEARLRADFVPVPGASVVLELDVAPGEHYERMYQAMLARYPELAPEPAQLLRAALTEVRARRYALPPLRAGVPSKAGATAQAVAN